MSKQRLDEATIRRQLELAGKPELFESYRKKLQEQAELEEETVEEGEQVDEVKTDEQSRGGEGTNRLDEEDLEEGVETVTEEEEEEVPAEEPAPEMDVSPEPEMDDEMGGEMDEGDVEGLVSVIAQAITDHTGIPVDVEGGEEVAPEMDAEPATDEVPAEVPAEEPEMEMGDEEELMEDAAQEAARGMPKPGTADHIDDGSLEGVTDSSEKVEHAHADHKMKDQPTTSKSLQEKQVRALAERVYRRVVRKIQEAKKAQVRKQKIQEARKRIAARKSGKKV